ncbi:MAG: hypothetical protein JRE23_03020 [Deltaproteobacteria bacterium]|nr:hypothetical protein [Deltaproteobacteria bacterium]
MRIARIVMCMLSIIFLFPVQPGAGQDWEVFHGRIATIRYHDEDQISSLSKKIRYDLSDNKGINLSQSISPKAKDALYNQLEAKIEMILARVQFLLDMNPKKNPHFTIQIYSTAEELRQYYSDQYGFGGDFPVAFYDADEDTIYISLKEINERIMAHEMAHMIIDQSFHVTLPIQVQEILAQYVDMHLSD